FRGLGQVARAELAVCHLQHRPFVAGLRSQRWERPPGYASNGAMSERAWGASPRRGTPEAGAWGRMRPVSTRTTVELDRARIAEMTAREQQRLDETTPGSRAMFERARQAVAGGVASAYQRREPWPIYLERGVGSKVWDVDGTERIDFHNAFGSMPQGHAHPAITKAVTERMEMGTHFAAPTHDAAMVAEELQRRWGLPRWRYTNSGSESTMDAIRIARAYAKRDTVMKIFGSYHGHHDTVMVSIGVEYDKIGDRDNLASLPYGAGIPQATVDMTVAVPFNDAGAMERRIERLADEGRLPAVV